MKLAVEKLEAGYQGKTVVKDISFTVEKGEFISLIGPSGCGKSTVLKVLAGLLEPMAGTIKVDDEALRKGNSHFSYMPQNDLLLDWYDILDNVCLYGKIHGKLQEARQQALADLKEFGLAGYEHAFPAQLSGGMRQRAAFLRTALCDSDILLLDEPFGALDVITREDMQDWLNRMRQRLDRTTLLVTHDIDEAIYLSDRILILGQRPASITRIVDVRHPHKDRAWLYAQGGLRAAIHQELSHEVL